MAHSRRTIIWTLQARSMLDEAANYIAQDSLAAAQRLVLDALDAGAALASMSERGRSVPELHDLNTRELFIHRYRLIYEVHQTEVRLLAFLHGARDFGKWRLETQGKSGDG